MEQDWKELWTRFSQDLQESGELLLNAAPAEIDRAEALRYISRLVGNAVSSYLEPKWANVPVLAFGTGRIGGDNPDYRYGNARLDGRLRYRLRGKLNGADRIAFSTFTNPFGTARPMRPTGAMETDNADFPIQPDGSFDILISSSEEDLPRIPMTAETTFLMVRELRTRRDEAPAEYQLICLSSVEAAQPMGAEALFEGLTDARNFLHGTVRTFLKWTERFRSAPNQILPLPPEFGGGGGGDRTSAYYNGYYELPDRDHALVIRFQPPDCTYWNLQALDHWLESLDTPQSRSLYNKATVQLAPDGSVTAVMAAQDPGIANWIDTAGHLHGGIVVRVVGAHGELAPLSFHCELVPLSQIRKG